jgi:hypothetical protein
LLVFIARVSTRAGFYDMPYIKGLLQTYLHDDLGHKPEIFLDERIEVGADWVDELGENLAKSKVVVALFSGSYFGRLVRSRTRSDRRARAPTQGQFFA